jgi:hypothetical protein
MRSKRFWLDAVGIPSLGILADKIPVWASSYTVEPRIFVRV